MTETIEALGLMFTNVEADQSPTRQRGFQVWQASAGLSAEARREITRRVDDYRVPSGTPPEAVAAFPRDAFFRVAGGFAVARTVPLAGKDKFGRGGRFFAHALVVTAADFARLHSDPFALFDAAEFSADPERVKEWHPDWLKGVLPPATLQVARSTSAGHPGPVRALLAGHLDREPAQRKTVVVVGKPADVAGQLRTVYRGLPPQLRAAAEFDTLSAGASLTQVPCAFAGCPEATALKMWAFRRFARFDPAAGTLTPADPPPRPLAAALPGTDAWADAADEARAAAWDAAVALEAGNPAAAADALEADPGALAVLERAPGFAAALEGLREEWFTQCPAVVTAVPGVRECLDDHLSGPVTDRLRRLQGGVPRGLIAEILLQQIGMLAYRGDSPGDLGHIQAWYGNDPDGPPAARRLGWVLSRLRYRDAVELGRVLTAGADDDAEWFRTWVRDYMEAEHKTAPTLLQKLAHELTDDQVAPGDLYDTALYLNCCPSDPADVVSDLRFRHACRTGGIAGLIARRESPDLSECLAYFRSRSVLGWTVLGDGTFFGGAFVYPRSEQDADLLAGVAEMGVDGRKLLHIVRPETSQNFGPAPPRLLGAEPSTHDFLDKLKPAKGKVFDAVAFSALQKEMAGYGEAFARESIGYLRDKLGAEPLVELGSPGTLPAAALFGVRWVWGAMRTAPPQLTNLFQVILGTAAPQLDRLVFPAAELRDHNPANLARLLSWM